MTFARETTHTARKAHRCDACGRRIEPGERYTRYAGIYEDGFATGAYHPDCREWEIKLCRDFDLYDDEWRGLSDFVAEDGPIVLDGAPEAVRARFGLAADAGGAR